MWVLQIYRLICPGPDGPIEKTVRTIKPGAEAADRESHVFERPEEGKRMFSRYKGGHRAASRLAIPPRAGLASLAAVATLVVALGAGAVNAVGNTRPTTLGNARPATLGNAMNASALSLFTRNTTQSVSRSEARRDLVTLKAQPGEVWQLQEERRARHEEVLAARRAEAARVVKAAAQATADKKAAAAKVVSDAAAARDAKAASEAKSAASARAAWDAAAARAASDDSAAPTEATTGIKAWAARELTRMGYGPEQFTCLKDLWNRESRWSYLADNPRSHAYGIPQALPAEKMASAGPDWRNNPKTQIIWGLGYIRDRYLTPCRAWARSETLGWY